MSPHPWHSLPFCWPPSQAASPPGLAPEGPSPHLSNSNRSMTFVFHSFDGRIESLWLWRSPLSVFEPISVAKRMECWQLVLLWKVPSLRQLKCNILILSERIFSIRSLMQDVALCKSCVTGRRRKAPPVPWYSRTTSFLLYLSLPKTLPRFAWKGGMVSLR